MSKRNDVLLAVKALVIGALPAATVSGFDKEGVKPKRGSPGGDVVGFPGDVEDPQVDLSPLTYFYSHRIPLEIAASPDVADQNAMLDGMFEDLASAISADRTLGGLCDWIEADFPDVNDLQADGAMTVRWANVAIVANYSTTDPLA